MLVQLKIKIKNSKDSITTDFYHCNIHFYDLNIDLNKLKVTISGETAKKLRHSYLGRYPS